ncbi:hypothetical protein JCM8547_002113 [Rhodosporidiobolus lusitaniae]
MARLYFHHFATLLLLASSILLLVTCITAPTVNDLILVIIQATVFGVLRDKCRDIPGVAADYGAAFWCTISALPVLLTALSCCLAAAFSDRHREKGWF